MRATWMLFLLFTFGLVASANAGPIQKDEVDYQNQNFEQWWQNKLVWKFDALPTEGKVPDFRIPYSGHDYPDKGGGTVRALVFYDRAFHTEKLATDWERKDVGQHKGLLGRWPTDDDGRRRPFARLAAALRAGRTPGWYGHCNGWTAASIRHAEPQNSVVRNGVVFSPAVIKGLLAEIYMYSNIEFLGGVDTVINPATFHVTLTNWLGKGAHPVGMETHPGEEVWNYPLYSYKYTTTKHSDRRVEVKLNATYAKSITGEVNKSPRLQANMYFHYMLDLDEEGKITGGSYYRDSAHIDMLWAPLQPTPGGSEGNERGNPHVDVKTVLALWRASVPESERKKWLNINPTKEDAVID